MGCGLSKRRCIASHRRAYTDYSAPGSLITFSVHPDLSVPYSEKALSAIQQHWHMPDVCFPDLFIGTAMCFSPVCGNSAWEGECFKKSHRIRTGETLNISSQKSFAKGLDPV